MDPSPLRITTCLPTNCNIVRFFPNSLQQKLIKVLCMYINPNILNVLIQCSSFGHQTTSVLRFHSLGWIFQHLHAPLFKCNDLQIHLWVLHLLHPTMTFQYKNYKYEDQASDSQYIFKPQGQAETDRRHTIVLHTNRTCLASLKIVQNFCGILIFCDFPTFLLIFG